MGDCSKVWTREGGWCYREVRKGYRVGVWKAIKSGWEVFKGRTCFKVDNESEDYFSLLIHSILPIKK